jgi:RING-box protein 1
MEIIKLDVLGYYFYCPDIQIENYDKYINKNKLLSECAICKRFILEPSYDTITDNQKIIELSNVIIGKCGHIFHNDCMNNWLKTNKTCPIDKINWQTYRVADTSTKLILNNDKKQNLSKISATKTTVIRKENNYPLGQNNSNNLEDLTKNGVLELSETDTDSEYDD